jgi:hypothetical protein
MIGGRIKRDDEVSRRLAEALWIRRARRALDMTHVIVEVAAP